MNVKVAIVAEVHLYNIFNACCIYHKNGIKTDNRVENLEWCTHSENNKHAYDTGLHVPIHRRKVIDLCSGGVYASLKEAAIKNGLKKIYVSWLFEWQVSK